MNDKSVVNVNSNNQVCDEEITLVDIYLSVKRNRKIFFYVILVSFLISILLSYLKFQENTRQEKINQEAYQEKTNQEAYQEKAFKLKEAAKSLVSTELMMTIEIGHRFSSKRGWRRYFDNSDETALKINQIYIPKVFREENIEPIDISKYDKSIVINKDKEQMVISAKGMYSKIVRLSSKTSSKKIDSKKILKKIAEYVLEDHNRDAKFKSEYFDFIPSRIVQEPIKIIRINNNEANIKKKKEKKKNENIKKKNKNEVTLIPILGLILGVFFGLIAVYIKEFLNKANETEKLLNNAN